MKKFLIIVAIVIVAVSVKYFLDYKKGSPANIEQVKMEQQEAEMKSKQAEQQGRNFQKSFSPTKIPPGYVIPSSTSTTSATVN